jgi:hypothetical protein
LSHDDLLLDFSESPGAEGTPVVEGPGDLPNGRIADSDVNEIQKLG